MRNSRHPASLVVVGLLLVSALARAQQPQSPQEEKRKRLLKQLGLEKTDAPPPAPAPPAPPAEANEPAPPSKSEGGRPTPERRAAAPSFQRVIHPLLMSSCGAACHRAGGPAMATKLVLSGDVRADHAAVARLIDTRVPTESRLLAKVSGAQPHGGGPLWTDGSAPREKMLEWIRRGAPLDVATGEEPKSSAPAAAAPPHANRGAHATPAAPSAPAETTELAPAPAAAAPASTPAAPVSTAPTSIHPILMSACAPCHRVGGPAAATRLLLSGDAAADEAAARAFVDPRTPAASPLLAKASGAVMHGGGAVLPAGDPRYAALLAWATPIAPAAPSAAAPPPAVVPAPPPSAPPLPAPGGYHHGGAGGIGLPLGFFLNGRFDLDYERRQFNGNPFEDGSVNALRSYHHFLFLSRETGAPCGLSLEVLTLLFWEAHCRVPVLPGPLRATIAGGKIVVPFGADPLFHQSYGGLEGFDQQILPAVWAVEGAAAHFVLPHGSLAFTDDLFGVRGYALPHADSVLNLQNDFSPVDATRFGVGNRLGFAWLGVSAWYSLYWNPLGFGRRLFMQAGDVMIARPRTLPVLGHFSAGAGLLRADVSGGGPGLDYYDFGSYFQLRYHPTDWLYVQYRQGLRTFDNRRGVILDNSRLTSADASAHNFGVVGRWNGLTAGVFYFINLEKVNEVPNDLLRVSLTYDF